MKQEEKELLLKSLCEGIPYNVKFKLLNIHTISGVIFSVTDNGEWEYFVKTKALAKPVEITFVKPYLRPTSSMTEEEILELYKITYSTWYSDSLYYKNEEWINFRDSIQNNSLCFKSCIWISDINKVIDWLNKKHFDYRGLIEKGLVLSAPEGMYK